MGLGLDAWLEIVGSVVFLALAGLAGIRGKQNPLAWVLALLCLDLFAYTSLSLVSELTDVDSWRWRERAAASLAAPLGIHLVVAFVGVRRRYRPLIVGSYAYFVGIAGLCLLTLADGDPLHGDSWATLMLVGMAPGFLVAALLVVRHARRERSAEERLRTYLLIGAIGLGVGGATTDLIHMSGYASMPMLASAGLTLSALVLSAAVLQFDLIEGRSRLALLHALVIGTLGVFAQVSLFTLLGANLGLLGIATVVVFVVVIVAARPVLTAYAAHRERTAYLVTLGRLAAQMAHDVRNPLAAIRGAAQFLEQELAEGRTDEQMLALIVEQSDRLERVIAGYHRYGRVEPERRMVDLNELVDSVLRAREASLVPGAPIAVRRELAWDLPPCDADPDLLGGAVENLVRNACDAMPGGGTLAVRTEVVRQRGQRSLRVVVCDDGEGMDPRAQERAFESFFTTKAQGTGLGLPFVQRVAEVHGGECWLESRLGEGTRVTLSVSI